MFQSYGYKQLKEAGKHFFPSCQRWPSEKEGFIRKLIKELKFKSFTESDICAWMDNPTQSEPTQSQQEPEPNQGRQHFF